MPEIRFQIIIIIITTSPSLCYVRRLNPHSLTCYIWFLFSAISFVFACFVSSIPAPDLPFINRIDSVTSSSVVVRWSTGDTRTIHNMSLLCKDTNDTSFAQVQYMSDVTSRSFNVSNLQPGHNYSFRVTVWSYDKSNSSIDVYQLTS